MGDGEWGMGDGGLGGVEVYLGRKGREKEKEVELVW